VRHRSSTQQHPAQPRTTSHFEHRSGEYRSAAESWRADSLLAAVSFASCYVYSPRASGYVAEAARQLCARVKASDSLWLPRYAGFVYRSSLEDRQLAALFAPGAVLVPIPGSARTGAAPWAALRLATSLRDVGFALRLWTGLLRRCSVTKSATAPRAARPTVQQHYDSLETVPVVVTMPAPRIVLIDDVITKGRTMLAAAARLRSALPEADIRGFALIRTQGFWPHIEHLAEPCHGVVRWAGGDARRQP
jgi:hypothetical protein